MSAGLRSRSRATNDPIQRTPRQVRDLETCDRWAQATGATLLVVDPLEDTGNLCEGMASRGLHVTWVRSALDGLIEFGRTNPSAVLIAPEVRDLPAADFVAKIRQRRPIVVIAGMDVSQPLESGPLILAGVSATIPRPYSAEEMWALLHRLHPDLDELARVRLGPLELDARAYTVRVRGVRLHDPPLKEFELLRTLMGRAPQVLSDDELRASVWGVGGAGPSGNAVSVHIARLRSRLDGVAEIRRIRGRGYSLTLI